MKQYVFLEHTIQSSVNVLHTVQQQLYSRINCSSLYDSLTTHYTRDKITESQVSCQWSSIHYHPSPQLKRLVHRFILPLERSPDADKRRLYVLTRSSMLWRCRLWSWWL